MRAVILPLAAAMIALSGCTALDDLDRRLSAVLDPQEVEAASVADGFEPMPKRKPTDVPPAKREALPKDIVAVPPSEAPKPQPAPKEAEEPVEPVEDVSTRGKLPESLVGVSADQLRARFGAPTLEIEETPGMTWRYELPQCMLDIHLFPRVESQGLYALDVSAKGLTVDECLAILAARQKVESDENTETSPVNGATSAE